MKSYIFVTLKAFINIKKKQTAMKKLLTLTLLGMFTLFAFASCKSSSGEHCDAYGSVKQVSQSDVASK